MKEGETLKEFMIIITQMCYRVDRNMTEGEVCEQILKSLPEVVDEKFGLLDNITTDMININVEIDTNWQNY